MSPDILSCTLRKHAQPLTMLNAAGGYKITAHVAIATNIMTKNPDRVPLEQPMPGNP